MQKDMGRMRKDLARGSEQIQGAGEEMKGSLKKGMGEVLDDDSLRAEGEFDKAKGKVRQKLNE
jgi:uncharacterized protein YjbJ (UPF0337 family)